MRRCNVWHHLFQLGMQRESSANVSARGVVAHVLAGTTPFDNGQGSVRPHLQHSYFSSSVIRSNNLRVSSAIPAVK